MNGFEADLAAHLPRLRRFARSLTRDFADADDLVQLTVERALARRGQWRPGTNLLSWMFTIMKNAWIDERRAATRKGRLHAPSEAAAQSADPTASDPVVRQAVQQAMDALPEDQRLAVALVLVEGLSYAEASQVLQIPEGTLTSRLVRGRNALMERLSEGGRAP